MTDLLALFVAIAAFWFVIVQVVYQKRRTDTDLVKGVVLVIRETQILALDSVTGTNVDLGRVRTLGQSLLDIARMEMPHRREDVQRLILDVVEKYFEIAECADGRRKLTPIK